VINNNVRLEDQEWGTEHAPNLINAEKSQSLKALPDYSLVVMQ
jgi:hypothetical protein